MFLCAQVPWMVWWVLCIFSVFTVDVGYRALCRTKLLTFTRVLEDTWMLTVKPVYKL